MGFFKKLVLRLVSVASILGLIYLIKLAGLKAVYGFGVGVFFTCLFFFYWLYNKNDRITTFLKFLFILAGGAKDDEGKRER